MAASISLRGKDNLYKHFKNANHPYWKLYNASDVKSPIQVCLHVKDVGKALEYLTDIIDSVDPNGTYIIDTFAKADGNGEQRFLKPSTSMCFSLNEKNEIAETVSETKSTNNHYTPASLKEHLDLIKENAKLSMECTLYKERWEDAVKKIQELENEIEELEDELENYEEEEEEEESVGGVPKPPKNMNEALSRLVSEHGGVIVENLVGGKGVKEKIDFDTTPEEEEEEGKKGVKVNGTGDILDLDSIILELKTRDVQFHKHMYKLLLIARQKPITFKMFLKKLEEF